MVHVVTYLYSDVLLLDQCFVFGDLFPLSMMSHGIFDPTLVKPCVVIFVFAITGSG